MRRVVQQLHSTVGVQPDNYTLTLLASCLPLDELLTEWRQAVAAGLRPDTVTVTAVLKTCCLAEQPGQVKREHRAIV